MTLIERIKSFFYNRALNQKLQGFAPKRSITNLADAKKVGIVYDSSNPDNDIIVTKYAEDLRKQGKQVELMGFVNDKKIDHKADILVFNPNHLEWTGVPKDERINKFAATDFDLMIGAFTGSNLALEYIAYTSKAKWRVGPYLKGKKDAFDLMIRLGDKTGLDYLLKQITHFLNQIHYDKK